MRATLMLLGLDGSYSLHAQYETDGDYSLQLTFQRLSTTPVMGQVMLPDMEVDNLQLGEDEFGKAYVTIYAKRRA